MTGYELARRVRASELGLSKRLPILGITASTAPEELSMCREAGMDDCFVKPTRLATLRDHLNRWRAMDGGSAAAGTGCCRGTAMLRLSEVRNR